MKSLFTIALFATLFSFNANAQFDYYLQGDGLDISVPTNWKNNLGNSPNVVNGLLGITNDIFHMNDLAETTTYDGVVNSSIKFHGNIEAYTAGVNITISDGVTLTVADDGSVSGGSDITVTGSGTLSMSGTAGQTLPLITGLDTLELGGSSIRSASGDVSPSYLSFVSNSVTLQMGSNAFSATGVLNSGTGNKISTENNGATPVSAITYPSGVNVVFTYNSANGSDLQTIPAATYSGGITIESGTNAQAGGNIVINDGFSIAGSFDMQTYTLSGTGTVTATAGTFYTANTSSTPFPAGCTFYHLMMRGAADQTVPSCTVDHDLLLNQAGTITASGAISADRIDFLSSANFDMATHQLTDVTSFISFSGTHTFTTGYTGGGFPYPSGLSFNNANVTVEFDGAGDQDIPGGTVYVLNLAGSGTKSLSNSESLTIGSGSAGTLDIQPGVALSTASGTTLTIDHATLTLHADASNYSQMKVLGTLTNNSGSYVKEHYLDVSSPRYFNMGAGVSGATFNSLAESGATIVASSGSTGSVWLWNATNSQWTAPSSTSDNMSAYVGYTIFAGTNAGTDFLRGTSGTVSAEGTAVVTTDAVQPITYHDGSGTNTSLFTPGSWGWNFYSNPFTATYDWSGQSLPANVNNAVYIWDEPNNRYTSYVGTVGANGGTQYIAPGQSFWVQSSATPSQTTFTMPYSQTTVSNAPTFFKTVPDHGKLELRDTSGNIIDETAIRFDNNATLNFDGAFDAYQRTSGTGRAFAYVEINKDQYSICSTPTYFTHFPVSVDINGGGEVFTFTFNDNDLTAFNEAVLEDRYTGKFTTLTQGGSYAFTMNSSQPKDRFILHFTNNRVDLDEFDGSDITVGIVNHQLYLFNQSAEMGTAVSGQVIDVNGRVIESFTTRIDSEKTTLPLPSMATGVYFVKLATEDATWTEKIIIQ